MAITYSWNPFQDNINNNVKKEVIKTASQNNRLEFVPRAAPFFARNSVLRVVGQTTPLVLGTDYVFGHPFDRFIQGYNRNVFGSVILLKPFNNVALEFDSSTIGGPFILDDNAFATLVANIMNSPRIADWSTLVNVPGSFPPDPHPHPASQTYDYLEMMQYLQNLVVAVADSDTTSSTRDLLTEHINKRLQQAHAASKADIGLDNTPNMAAATNADLAGNSANLLMTVAVFKEGLRQFARGDLNLG